MRSIATSSPIHGGKRRLLESCAIAAGLAALACGGPALAQVAANPVFVNVGVGTSINSNGGTKTTTVNVTQNQSVINWIPTDNAPTGGAIDVLPADSIWNFNGTGNYVVLNRFTNGAGGSLSRQIALSGTVNSYDVTTGAQGGSVWFYNAGGILINGGAAINVGSLVLTTNDIDRTGGLFGPSGEIRFRGASGSTATVQIDPGAFINADMGSPGGAYVAMVAPRIVQGGGVYVNGSAAYVAAEQADIRINAGLFDINVLTGAEGGNVITHTGVTTGPEQQTGGAAQRIYMVAIPKNDAVSMLVSGQVGYQDAVSATTDSDGAVVLAAGYNVTGGAIDTAPVNATAANITVNDIIFRSNTTARASGAFVGQPLATIPVGGPVSVPPPPQLGLFVVQGNGSFTGDASATIGVGAGQAAGATGSFTLQSGGIAGADGVAAITIDGGQFQADQGLSILSSGLVDAATGNGGGGSASLTLVNGGQLSAPSVTVGAIGMGGIGAGGAGGTGTGGNATVTIDGTGSALTTDTLLVSASGVGGGLFDGQNGQEVVDTGGNGRGGTATVAVTGGGSLTARNAIDVSADGFGMTGNLQSGTGTGGTARLTLAGASSQISASATNVSANGIGGGDQTQRNGPDLPTLQGGAGLGGTAAIVINADATATASLGDVTIAANGEGGVASSDENARGGDGTGGNASLAASGGGTAAVASLAINADGSGGGAISPSTITAQSGNSLGGIVTLRADGGSTIDSDSDIALRANGRVTGFENIGNGAGGTINVDVTTGGLIRTADQFTAQADGGGSSATVIGLAVGSASGGTVNIRADGGGVQAGNYSLSASAATHNSLGAVGTARGGSILLQASNDGSIQSINVNQVNQIRANGRSGAGDGGADGVGGSIQLTADAGSIGFAGQTYMTADGVAGGDSSYGAAPVPVGRGGSITVQLLPDASDSSSIAFGDVTASADGQAYVIAESLPGVVGAGAANGEGGTVTIAVNGGTLNAGTATFSADGTGGAPGSASGGLGVGGTLTYTQTAGSVFVGSLSMSANGTGGSTQRGSGDGTGGAATMTLSGGTLNANGVSLSANGYGGVGYTGGDSFSGAPRPARDGGNGQGGNATLMIDGTATVIASTLAVYAGGSGGRGGDFYSFGSNGDGGSGGTGTGGTATIHVISGDIDAEQLVADAAGFGGSGGSAQSSSSTGSATGLGVGGRGGAGTGGTATIDTSTVSGANTSVASYASGSGGSGGSGSSGGNGGLAAGGLAQIIINDFDAGSMFVSLDAAAFGGNGGYGADGDGGDGGAATGGTGRVEANGAAARATLTQESVTTNAFGGNGGNADTSYLTDVAIGGRGGAGGNGTGGTLEVVANDGAMLTLSAGEGGVGLNSLGYGGNGGSGADNAYVDGRTGGDGGNGGAGIGGTVRTVANGGTITSDGQSVFLTAVGVSGVGGAGGAGITDTNGVGGNGLNGNRSADQGGLVTLASQSTPTATGLISLGDTVIDAGGTLAGRIEILADGLIQMASLDASAFGSAAPTNNDTDTASAGIFVRVGDGGSITTDGDMELATDGSIGVYAAGSGQVAAGRDANLQAGDQIDLRHDMRSGSAPTIAATRTLVAFAGNSISGTAGTYVAAGGDLSMAAGTTVAVGDVEGATVSLDGATGVSAGSVSSGGATNLTSAGGNLNIGLLNSVGDVVASANAITIADGDNLTFATLAANVGGASVQNSGDLTVANGTVVGLADLRSNGGQLNIASLTAGSANLEAGGGGMSLTNIATTGDLTGSAFGSLAIDGVVTGRNISLASWDIAIGANGRVGTAGVTQGLALRNNSSDSQTFVGGTGTRPGYHIDATELTRLYGSDIVIFAPRVASAGSDSVGSTAPPDVIIDGFTIAGGAGSNLGANGSLTIQTPGKARVVGAVQLTGLSSANALNIFANEALEVILGQGSIRLTNGSSPAGMLNLRSADIIVATPQAITDVAAATTLDAIEQRLAQNDGIASDDGALFAGGISASVSGGFYVQNSGLGTAYAQRRGLTFAGGGLNVTAQSPSARIVINGVQLGPSGQVTGLDTITQLRINGSVPTPGTFDPRSTFNGCTITATGACQFGVTEFPVQDVIDDPEEPGKGGDGISLPTPLITIRDIDPLSGEPLLDDPVTGAGNDDLWTPVSP